MGGGGFLGSGSTATQALSADVSRTPKPIGHPVRGGRSPCNRMKVATWGWTARKSAGSSGRRVGRVAVAHPATKSSSDTMSIDRRIAAHCRIAGRARPPKIVPARRAAGELRGWPPERGGRGSRLGECRPPEHPGRPIYSDARRRAARDRKSVVEGNSGGLGE